MKINPTTPSTKQLDKFDKELKAILTHDLYQFHKAQGQFLRTAGKRADSSLLVA